MKNHIFIVLAVIAIICLAICPAATAKQTVNSSLTVTDITDTTISWFYTYLSDNRPLGATLDGVEIEGWKTDLVYNYTATGLKPETYHEFCIFGDATANCESATTLKSTEIPAQLEPWIITLVIMVCCVVGMMRRLGIFLPIASVISLIGLYSLIQETGMTGSDPITDVQFYIYIAFFIIPLWLVFGIKKGVFK